MAPFLNKYALYDPFFMMNLIVSPTTAYGRIESDQLFGYLGFVYKMRDFPSLTKNMTIFTAKLNEFKDCYLDLQSEHLELLSEHRDISKA